MRAGWLAAVGLAALSGGCALTNGLLGVCDGVTFTANVNMTIPDNDDTGITSTLAPSATGRPDGIGIRANIEHSFESDLSIRVFHGGITVTLDDKDDHGPFHEWDAVDVSGPWMINVADTQTRDIGFWNDWELIICGA